jgi:hypothetical protein
VIVDRREHVTGKALSVRQPWAWAIVEGYKPVENRKWPTRYRGPLLIHAGLQDDLHGWHFLDEMGFPLPVDPPTGGIMGIVDLVDCVQGYDSPWAMEGYYHWILENPRRRNFVPMSGTLGLFDVDPPLSARKPKKRPRP